MHGYLLRQHAKEYSWIYPMTNASIYPALHNLEEEGFVVHESEIHNGRARKVYSITEAGRAELGKWLVDPTAQSMTFRDQVLLKLSMQSDETMRYARTWVQLAVEQLREEVEHYDLQLKDKEDMGKYTLIAMEYGVDQLRLRIRFLERVMDACENPSDS